MEAARGRVGDLRAALLRPRECDIEACITRLREAEGYLEWLRDSLDRQPRRVDGLGAQARALHAEIGQAAVLLEQAARYGRRRLDGRRPPEYDALGAPAPFLVRGSVSLLG